MPETYKETIISRISLKHMVFYAYVLLPSHIESVKAIKLLQIMGDTSDKYFINLAETYKVHLILFNAKFRHIIIWGDEKEIKEVIDFLGEILKKPMKRDYEYERERRDERGTYIQESK